jgi:hypothetical protein
LGRYNGLPFLNLREGHTDPQAELFSDLRVMKDEKEEYATIMQHITLKPSTTLFISTSSLLDSEAIMDGPAENWTSQVLDSLAEGQASGQYGPVEGVKGELIGMIELLHQSSPGLAHNRGSSNRPPPSSY